MSIFQLDLTCLAHTVLIQSLVSSSSIQPFSWTLTMTPFGNFSLGMVFGLNIMYGVSLVKRFFSFPVVLIGTALVPINSIVLDTGRSKVSGVWSALPIIGSLCAIVVRCLCDRPNLFMNLNSPPLAGLENISI